MHKSFGQDTRVLRDDELDAVAGGIEGYPGLFPGTGRSLTLLSWRDRCGERQSPL
jgi:hypothetical protein